MVVKTDGQKFSRNASAAAGDYAAGARAPRADQAQAAAAAEPNYEAGVQAAIARKAFSKGLQRAGSAKWLKGVEEKGRGRYAQGVQQSGGEWEAGFAPFAQVLSSMTLQPRGPKGQNFGRVEQVGRALLEKRLQG